MDPNQPISNQDPTANNQTGAGKKILLVEDEKPISDLYLHILTKAGYQVKTAYDGKAGLDTLSKEKFDLLLLDIMLPGVNGLELLRQWKMQNPQSAMIVLLLTNLGQDAVIKEAFSLGASGYLIKASLTPTQVLTEINNAITSAQQPNPQPQTP